MAVFTYFTPPNSRRQPEIALRVTPTFITEYDYCRQPWSPAAAIYFCAAAASRLQPLYFLAASLRR